MTDGVVPTSVYCRLLEQRGRDLDRIQAVESMLLDAWLVCQAGRVDDGSHVVRVLAKRVSMWKAVLDSKADGRECSCDDNRGKGCICAPLRKWHADVTAAGQERP